MHNGDVLGDEGRQALNACVKVKIIGKPETRRYDGETALKRLQGCFAGWSRLGWWLNLDYLLLPSFYDENGRRKMDCTYGIVDIHNALVKFDEMSCVEKYPKQGPGSAKLRDLIDKRRADVERELEEAKADPDGRHKYSWVVAQRRVRDCFAGNFAEDRWTVPGKGNVRDCFAGNFAEDRWTVPGKGPNESYNINDIHKAFGHWDDERETAEAKRATLLKEYHEAVAADEDTNIEHKRHKYNRIEAINRLRDCYLNIPVGWLKGDFALETKMPASWLQEPQREETTRKYDIFDIHKAFLQFNGRKLLEKYPEEGPGSDELKKLIDEHRTDLKEEYQKATSDTGSKSSLREYSRSEAERRVRDCFAGTFLPGIHGDSEIFPMVNKDENDQTYNIFDIKRAIDSFDAKTFADVSKYESEGEPSFSVSKQEVDEQRADIQREYELATSSTEIEHGSGFIVHNHFIITNRHVIETCLNETESHEIHISNAAIGELACKISHYDAGKDLALLYCPDLNLEQSGICPLLLSNQPLLPGMSIFSFGYPVSHTEETALFVNGNVSGSKRTLAGHSMVVLNCSLNSGNSGGPVLCWVKGQLRVVGVATQKHFKEILTLEERESIEKIRESLQTHAIADVPDDVRKCWVLTHYYSYPKNCQTPMFLLTLKLYDALETHSQFNLSNALPGHLVVGFINDSVSKYTGEYKEELAEIIKLSKDRVNILPSGHLSPSQCCIQ